MRTVLQAEDFFVPAVILSVHFVPIDRLDVVLTARLSDGIDAGASLNLTTGWFGTREELSFVPQETNLTGARLQAGAMPVSTVHVVGAVVGAGRQLRLPASSPYVRADNERAHALHAAFGFVREGTRARASCASRRRELDDWVLARFLR